MGELELSEIVFADDHTTAGPARQRSAPRHVRALVAAAVLVALAAIAGALGAWGPLAGSGDGSASGTGPEGLSMSAGFGPDAATLFPAGTGSESGLWGKLHVVGPSPDADGRSTVLYLTRSAFLCLGSSPAAGAHEPDPAMCVPLGRLPREGLAAGMTYSATPPKGRPGVLVVVGLVRGDITRVVVSTPDGAVDATLVDTENPTIGKLYWAQTTVPPSTASSTISRVAYRGTQPVFGCKDSEPACV